MEIEVRVFRSATDNVSEFSVFIVLRTLMDTESLPLEDGIFVGIIQYQFLEVGRMITVQIYRCQADKESKTKQEL